MQGSNEEVYRTFSPEWASNIVLLTEPKPKVLIEAEQAEDDLYFEDELDGLPARLARLAAEGITMETKPTWVGTDPMMVEYMMDEWGLPVHGETHLFERLCLEVFQSGLSWLTILKKRDAFRAAFKGFDPEKVAAFDEEKISQLLEDRTIVRNRRKILAAVTNARATLDLREGEGLEALVYSYQSEEAVELDEDGKLPTKSAESAAMAKDLKKRGFTFVGPTNMYALLCAIGVVDVRGALGI